MLMPEFGDVCRRGRLSSQGGINEPGGINTPGGKTHSEVPVPCVSQHGW